MTLVFLAGCVVGFLVCVIMTIDMLERNDLYVKDGVVAFHVWRKLMKKDIQNQVVASMKELWNDHRNIEGFRFSLFLSILLDVILSQFSKADFPCCKLCCWREAEWEMIGIGSDPYDVTYACTRHVGFLLGDADYYEVRWFSKEAQQEGEYHDTGL